MKLSKVLRGAWRAQVEIGQLWVIWPVVKAKLAPLRGDPDIREFESLLEKIRRAFR